MSTILLTGANRGLGEAVRARLEDEGHRVIPTARTQEKADAIGGRVLDLAELDSVRALAAALQDERVDVLFNNAGIMQQSRERRLTRAGFEETLMVNAVAPYLLTRLMLPVLTAQPRSRVINVSSRMHMPGSRGAEVDFDFDDPDLAKNYAHDRAYKNSKLALLWLTYEQQRRAPEGLSVNAVCPGFVPVTAAESTSGFQRWLLRKVLPHMSFTLSVEDAAANLAWCCTAPELDEGGKFYTERVAVSSSEASYDETLAARFWELCEARCG